VTKEELDLLRVRCAVVASQALLRFAAELIKGGSWPREDHAQAAVLKAIELRLSVLRREILHVTFGELHPVESDLWAGEILEAFDRLSKEFFASLDPQSKT
jgi:hypothetical protein